VASPASAPARAAQRCDGKLVFSKPLKFKQKKVGELDVYSDAATKKNCAIAFHAGSTWGKKLPTTISLYRCAKGDKEGGECHSDVTHMHAQSGKYRYQAGPVTYKAAHRCVFAWGEIEVRHDKWSDAMTGKFLTAHFCK
jgi:hypothetical protein